MIPVRTARANIWCNGVILLSVWPIRMPLCSSSGNQSNHSIILASVDFLFSIAARFGKVGVKAASDSSSGCGCSYQKTGSRVEQHFRSVSASRHPVKLSHGFLNGFFQARVQLSTSEKKKTLWSISTKSGESSGVSSK